MSTLAHRFTSSVTQQAPAPWI